MGEPNPQELLMTAKRIALVYFSATQVTHTYAEVMMNALVEQGCDVQLFNVTAYAHRPPRLPIAEFDGFIFGFPVFSDFAPSVINTWLETLEGKGKRCTQFFTYGARTTGYAHFHTKLLLEKAGFQVMLSAEFLGRHSFNVAGWQILPERPNEQDFTVAREYIRLGLQRFSCEKPAAFRLQKPFGYHHAVAALENTEKPTARGWTHPIRTVDECVLCRDCETECPTHAFNAHSGLSDPAECISCMHCVYICPDKVIEIDQRMQGAYESFKKSWYLTERMMNAKQSKIITEAWQAAS
jgi:NAD-dependent dihydropyrimidine dehydrogenase PreA subunit